MKELGLYFELTKNKEHPSMLNFISREPHPHKRDIIAYLRNEKYAVAYAPSVEKDVFTQANIPVTLTAYSDGKYSWYSTLTYYFDKYNLNLPEDFLNHIKI